MFAAKSGEVYSRIWVAAWLAGGFAATALLRIAMRIALRALRRRGRNLRHVAIVGAGTLGGRVAERLADAAVDGLQRRRVLRRRSGEARHVGRRTRSWPAHPTGWSPTSRPGRSTRSGSRCRCAPRSRARDPAALLREHAVEIRFVPDIFDFHAAQPFADRGRRDCPCCHLTATPMAGRARVVKTIEDYVLGAMLLALALPPMALIALGIKLALAGAGALPAGARDVERRAFRHAEVPHDAGERRVGQRPGVVAQGTKRARRRSARSCAA